MQVTNENHVDLERLGELIETGDLAPIVDWTVPLDEAPAAMRLLEAGRVRGKLAITI